MLKVQRGQPPASGEYIVYLSARQSGETDTVRADATYHAAVPEEAQAGDFNEFWVPYGTGGFVVEPGDQYLTVHYVQGWIGPLPWEAIRGPDREMQPWWGTVSLGRSRGPVKVAEVVP